MDDDPLIRGLVTLFVTEAQEISEIVARNLLELEGGGDAAALEGRFEEVARGLHTLKGSAGSLGLEDIASLSHRMEDLFAPLRRAKTAIPSVATDALLKGLDVLLARLRAHAAAEELPDLAPVLEAITRATGAGAGAKREVPVEIPLALREGGAAGKVLEAAPERAGVAEERDPKNAPDVAVPLGDARGGEPADAERSWRISARDVVSFMREIERLREVRLRLDERRREVQQALSTIAELPSTAETRSQLLVLGRALKTDAGEAADIVDALEERVKGIGTQPVSTIVDPLRRLVRDVSRSIGKEARLSVVGGEISLDRHVLQGLRESMVHIVRNAIDHGIETPEERQRVGKHREGALVLRIEQHGNVLYVEFADDGGGLDLDRLRETAVQQGLVARGQVGTLEPRDLYRLIFGSGFSTTTAITETSGRGVGLDVVKRWVDGLRGHIEVHSVAKQGTRFVFTLPAEFGSSPTLVVRVAEQELGIPIAVIERIAAATKESVLVGRTQMKFEHGDRLVPLRDLGGMLGLRQSMVPGRGQPIVLVQSQGVRFGIAVDEVIGDRELVIRAMPRELGELGAFQGASTMARGDLLLILRPSWLVSTELAEAPMAATKRALVVDDSLTARALHRAMLEAGGYMVHAVSSATQALEWLAHAHYDVVVCDLAMTPMDGFTFTTTVRTSQELRGTPIVVVSAREEKGLRERAVSIGADAFLSKSECAVGRLLAEVAHAIVRRKEIA